MKLQHHSLILPLIAALCLAQGPALSQPMDAKIFAERNSFVKLASSVTPSVVNIDVQKREVRPAAQLPIDDPAFRRFFGDDLRIPEQEQILSGTGSGVIISADGLILTNNHVVSGATDIEVTLHDGSQYTATLVGSDSTSDLAVLKVQADQPLPAARIGNSRDLPIGSWLMAVGNPYGLEETVTVGILSGKGRDIGVGVYDDFLQTDAAINPGNSGGGLFNSEGELVGINTAIVGQGLGFAIPIEMAQRVAADLQAHGKVMRGYLGVAIQDLSSSLRQALKLPQDVKGALLGQILADGPAGRSGLQPGDVVVEIGGRPVTGQRTLLELVSQARVGSSIPITVWREGRTLALTTQVGERPGETRAEASPAPAPRAVPQVESSGFTAVDLTPEMAHQLSMPNTRGVLLREVRRGSLAYRSGLRSGDVIVQAGGEPVASAADLNRLLGEGTAPVALLVRREGRQVFVALERSS